MKEQLNELNNLYGADKVQELLQYDAPTSYESLQKQLAYESKQGVTSKEYDAIKPYEARDGQSMVMSTSYREAGDASYIHRKEIYKTFSSRGEEVGFMCIGYDQNKKVRSLTAKGPYGVPEGWVADDKLTVDESGAWKARTIFNGPKGESGKVVRIFDGRTLSLDKAYRSSLPSELDGVPGMTRKVPTINYMTARTFRILGISKDNLEEIKGSRVQHQLTVAHLDWLRRTNPDKDINELIDHTSWAKNIRTTAAIVGAELETCPTVHLQGSEKWKQEHPDASLRGWDYPGKEAKRLTIEHITGIKIPKVDDPNQNWEQVANEALDTYIEKHCSKLSEVEAAEFEKKIRARVAAVAGEQERVEKRYGVPHDKGPDQMNFDVLFKAKA